jgi:hypothetical protein
MDARECARLLAPDAAIRQTAASLFGTRDYSRGWRGGRGEGGGESMGEATRDLPAERFSGKLAGHYGMRLNVEPHDTFGRCRRCLSNYSTAV